MAKILNNNYKLLPIYNLCKEEQLQILNIRNNENIRKWMLNENLISKEEHLNWIDKIKNDNNQKHFAILNEEEQLSGVVNISKIDYKNKNAEIGFYKSPDVIEKGLMTFALFQLIEYAFINIGLEKLYSEVIQDNIKSINIHNKLLFKEEGYWRSHIIRDGERIGIYLFGLLKDEWIVKRDGIDIPENISITPPPPTIV